MKTKSLKKLYIAQSVAIRRGMGDWARRNQEKANLFASHLYYNINPHNNNNNKLPEINGTQLEHSKIKFTIKEVKDQINPKKNTLFRSNNRNNYKGIKLFTFTSNAIMNLATA